MYIWEAVLSELKLAVFGSVTIDCGDFFSIDYECQDGDDCCIYLALGEVIDWNAKVFGKMGGKYLRFGRKHYNPEYDREFIDRWVDSFLKDIAVWLDKDDDVLVYLERLYNKRESCSYARFVDLDSFNDNVWVRLGGEIGHEKVVLDRGLDYLYYYLVNYDWLDDYELDTDKEVNVTEEAMGVLFGKLMCVATKGKVNPMIGAAGVSAVPMAARVVQKEGQREDPTNFLLMHAMGPNVAGVIGSAIAAGVLLKLFGA